MIFKDIKAIAFDFDGVFTNNKVYVNQFGIESVACSRSDGIGIKRLEELGIKMVIISTESNPVVSVRAKKIGIEVYQSVEDKSKALKLWSEKINVSLENIAFLGNDINDICAFSIVGFPIAVNDSFLEILTHTKYKLKSNGGEGAVRELCDLIFNSRK
jgi:3-deoxy-D-manno-octulosonate 8-phosphate phosphatase (KDO 8-P phosphatase)